MKINFKINKILAFKRYIRYLYLNRILNIRKGDFILDVGCGREGKSYEVFNKTNRIIGIDILRPEEINLNLRKQANFEYILCDAADMSIFDDNKFDVCICIGVLEHIVCEHKLLRISNEIRRVSKKYAICVPWKFTPLEPHFRLPFFQFYPDHIQYKLIKKFNLHGLGNNSFDYFKSHYQWLSSKQWKRYFPESKVRLCPTIFTIIIYGKTE